MNILNAIKSAISYIFTCFVGAFVYHIITNGFDFFAILGCVACVLVAVMTSPLFGRFFKFGGKGR